MIVVEKKDTAFSNGFADANQFTIKASAKAFRILSDKIYKNNILAIIRELSTNAVDSHIANGTPNNQFDVTLPSKLNPNFAVRDRGTGMSHDNVMKVFTTYFESTKEDTNDAFGTLGLGSKSPFSYVNTYTVTSWFGGEKRTYVAYISDADTPSILFAGAEPSDEPTGLEITFPVKVEDISRFRDEAVRVFRWFDNKPHILGVANLVYENYFKPEPDLVFNNWFVTESQPFNYYNRVNNNSGFYVQQGPILYPIDMTRLPSIVDQSLHHLSTGRAVVFKVSNGSVNFAPSREELSYDKHTIENLCEAIKIANNDLRKLIADKLTAETPYGRLVYIRYTFPKMDIHVSSDFVEQTLKLDIVPSTRHIKFKTDPDDVAYKDSPYTQDFKFYMYDENRYSSAKLLKYNYVYKTVNGSTETDYATFRYDTIQHRCIILYKTSSLIGIGRLTNYIDDKDSKFKNPYKQIEEVASSSYLIVIVRNDDCLKTLKETFKNEVVYEITESELDLYDPDYKIKSIRTSYAIFSNNTNIHSSLQFSLEKSYDDISSLDGYYFLTNSINNVTIKHESFDEQIKKLTDLNYKDLPTLRQVTVDPALFFSNSGYSRLTNIKNLDKKCYLIRICDLEEVVKNKKLKPIGMFIEELAKSLPSYVKTHVLPDSMFNQHYRYNSVSRKEFNVYEFNEDLLSVSFSITRKLKLSPEIENSDLFKFCKEYAECYHALNQASVHHGYNTAIKVVNRYYTDTDVVTYADFINFDSSTKRNYKFSLDTKVPSFDITSDISVFNKIRKIIYDRYKIKAVNSSIEIDTYFDVIDENYRLREELDLLKEMVQQTNLLKSKLYKSSMD